MRIDNKALALLIAAIAGSGLIACQRAGEDQGARGQGATAPMSQAPSAAPKQGYTGPATPAPGADTGGAEKSGQAADQAASPSNPGNPTDDSTKQPSNTDQEKPAR